MRAEKPDIDIGCNILFNNDAKKIADMTTYKIIEGYTEEQKQEEEYLNKCTIFNFYPQ